MKLPTRNHNRLENYDYSSPNAYFITACTKDRKNLFWSNADTEKMHSVDIQLSALGMVIKNAIEDIPKYYPAVSVDVFTIMPNHIHLLLQIHSDNDGRPIVAPTIATIMQHMKGVATKRIGFSVWQKGYYDHIIRDDFDYQEIFLYIQGNPMKWQEDKLFTPS